MWTDCPRLVIAAPSSGSGKSTVTTGLMACLAERQTVQGFKVGPDYIDPMYHTVATGRPSRNLDTWMVSADQVVSSFVRATQQADVAVIEGVMGLYDGYDGRSEAGSTAQVAKLLGAPVIMVLDVAKMARSAGALALGYRDFDPDLAVVGVICNRVASARHADYVTQAIEGIGLPVLGCIPHDQALVIPERHLGLHTAVERKTEVAAFLQSAGSLMKQHINLARLEQLAQGHKRLFAHLALPTPSSTPAIKLAVARDEAFCFYYADNLDLLRAGRGRYLLFQPALRRSASRGSLGTVSRRRLSRAVCRATRRQRHNARRDPRGARARDADLCRMRRLDGADTGPHRPSRAAPCHV